MKITKKFLLIIVITLILAISFFMFLENILVSAATDIEILNIDFLKKENDNILLNSTVKIINKIGFSLKVKSVDIELFYKNNLIGKGKIDKEFNVEKEYITHFIIEINSNKIGDLVKETFEKNKSEIVYKANSKVFISLFGFELERNYELKEKIEVNPELILKISGFSFNVKEIKILGRENDNLILETKINLTNFFPYKITINKAEFKIINETEIGKGFLNKTVLEKNKVKIINVKFNLKINNQTINLIKEIISKGKIEINYEVNANIFIHELNLKVNLPIKEKISYKFFEVNELFNLKKVSINEKEANAIIIFNNKLNIEFKIKNAIGKIYYKENEIGEIKIENEIEIKNLTLINLKVNIFKDKFENLINDFIKNKEADLKINLNINLNILNIDINSEINFYEKIILNPIVNGEIISATKLSENKILLDVIIKAKLSESFEIKLFINSVSFEIFYNNEKIGLGNVKNIEIFPNTNSTIKILLETFVPLKQIINDAISGKNITISIKNLKISFKIFEKSYFVNLEEINTNISNIFFSINLFPKLEKVEVINDKFNIEVKIFVDLGKIPAILVEIKEAYASIFINNLNVSSVNLVSKVYVKDDAETSFVLEAKIVKELTSLIIEEFINNEELAIKIKDLRIIANVLGEEIEVKFDKDLEVIFSPPLSLKIDLKVNSIKYGNNIKEFNLNGEIIINSSTNIFNIKLVKINSEVYIENIKITNLEIDLNYILNGNLISIEKLIKFKIEKEALEKFIEILLNNKKIDIYLKNIKLYIEISNEIYEIKIKNIKVEVKIDFKIEVYLSDFQIVYPGNKIIAPFEAKAKTIDFNIKPQELILNAFVNDTLVANIRLVSVSSSVSLIQGVLEATFTNSGMRILATPLVQEKDILILINEIRLKANLNGIIVEKEFNLENPFLLIIKHNFKINYGLRIIDITNKPPGNIFDTYVEIFYEYFNGINAPLKITYAKFEIKDEIGNNLGYGEINESITLTSSEGKFNTTANLKLKEKSVAWFIEGFMFKEEFKVIFSKINVTVLIFETKTFAILNDFKYVEKGPKIKLKIENIRVSSVTLSSINLLVNIVFNNPYNVSAFITFLPNSDKTIKFSIYEGTKDKHPGTNLGNGYYNEVVQILRKNKTVIKDIKVSITNILHVTLLHDKNPDPLVFDIQVYSTIKGEFGIMLYEVFGVIKFEIKNQFIKFVYSVL